MVTETHSSELMAAFPNDRARALYQHGLAHQWDLEQVIDWPTLHLERVAARSQMAAVYADVLYAEQIGLEFGARILDVTPEGWLRDFIMLQMGDEVRHIAFFDRVVTKLGGNPCTLNEELELLRSELTGVTGPEELMLHAQVLESGARATFIGNATRSLEVLNRTFRLPASDSLATLMRAIVEYVGRDEARHIATLTFCLRARLAHLPAAELRAIEQRLRVTATLFQRSLARRSKIFERLGLSSTVMLGDVWEAVQRQLRRLDLDIGEPNAL
jgi:hypothetical protein